MLTRILFALSVGLVATPALAYIGPGSGISLLGGLWGILVAIVLAIGAILIWPIRYVFRRLRRKRRDASKANAAEPTAAVDTERPSSRSE